MGDEEARGVYSLVGSVNRSMATYWRNRKSWMLAKRLPASPPGPIEALFV